MANPFDVPYELPEGETLITAEGCVTGPTTVMMRAVARTKLLERKAVSESSKVSFPDYCPIDMAQPAEGHRNFHVIQPGVTNIVIPELPGGCLPNRVFFNWCADCIIVNFDKEASVDEVLDGSGPEINPRFVYIGEQPVSCKRVDVISVLNTGDAPYYMTLQYNS